MLQDRHTVVAKKCVRRSGRVYKIRCVVIACSSTRYHRVKTYHKPQNTEERFHRCNKLLTPSAHKGFFALLWPSSFSLLSTFVHARKKEERERRDCGCTVWLLGWRDVSFPWHYSANILVSSICIKCGNNGRTSSHWSSLHFPAEVQEKK